MEQLTLKCSECGHTRTILVRPETRAPVCSCQNDKVVAPDIGSSIQARMPIWECAQTWQVIKEPGILLAPGRPGRDPRPPS